MARREGTVAASMTHAREEPSRRLPGEDDAQIVLLAAGGALEDTAAGPRLEDDRLGRARHGVSRRPPQRGALRPQREGVLRRACDRELADERLHQRRSVFSAASRKRAAA